MITAIQAITEASTVPDAIRITEEEGGALMRQSFDYRGLGAILALCDANLYTGPLETVDESCAQAVHRVVSRHEQLTEIDTELQNAGHPSFNLLSLLITQLGSSLPPHADNTFVTEGISLLIPRSHTGDLILYGDDRFNVSDWVVKNGHVTRITDVAPGVGEDQFIERRSEYSKGDVLFLRQDMPYRGLKAKVHSASSKSNPKDRSFHREIISADYVVTL